MNFKTLTLVVTAVLLASGSAFAQDKKQEDPKLKAYDELVGLIQKDPAGATEAQVRKLLELGKTIGRPYTTNLAVKGYLARSLSPAPDVLVLAADNAMLAGDYRTAVARYKAYLGKTSPSKRSSEAAGNLFAILVDHIRAKDDAFESIKKWGGDHRADISVRKYDKWFLNECTRRKDYVAMAQRLEKVFAQKLPLEQERYYFWDSLDWLMRSLSRGESGMFPALPHAKKIVSMVREDNRRSKKFALFISKLEYNTNYVAKEKEAMGAAFTTVVNAGKAYFDAHPDVDAVKDIWAVFSGGYDTVTSRDLNENNDQKYGLFAHIFPKLSEEDRKEAISYNYRGYLQYQYMASPQGWVDLASKHPQLFTSMHFIQQMPFDYRSNDFEQHKRQSAFLKDVPSNYAAVVNSLAAGGEFSDAIKHLMEKESWHLTLTEPYGLIRSYIWPSYSRFKRPDDKKLPGDYYHKAIYRFGRDYVAKSPMALFDVAAATEYINYTWHYSGKDGNDKSNVIPALQSLDWVPYDAKTRTKVFKPAYDQFKRWTDNLRKSHKADPKKVPAEVMAQISPLEAAFKKAMNVSVTDVSKAPNNQCKLLAQSIVASNQARAKDYMTAITALYETVKDWDVKRTPYGQGLIWVVLQRGPKGADVHKLHCRVIADHLARWTPKMKGDSLSPIQYVVNTYMGTRSGWRWGGIPAKDKADASELNKVFGNAILKLAEKDQFSPAVFYWWRMSRYGSGWNDWNLGVDVARTLFKKKLLIREDQRFVYNSAAASCMWFVNNQVPALKEEFPQNSAFDDDYLAEFKDTGKYDWSYWHYGHDKDHKIYGTVAKQFAGFTTLPFGYGKSERLYSRSDFHNWQGRLFNAPKEIRDAMINKIETTYSKNRFDEYAMGRSYFGYLAEVKSDEGHAEFFNRLKQYVDRAASQPDHVNVPYFANWSSVDIEKLTDEQIDTLVRMMAQTPPRTWHRGWRFEDYAALTHKALVSKERFHDLLPLVPQMWRIARQANNATFLRSMAQMIRHLVNGEEEARQANKKHEVDPAAADVATVYAIVGLDMMGTELPEDVRTNLLSVKSKSLSSIGGVIPVNRGDARWPIFKSQADFLAGRTLEAWDQYLSRQAMVQTMLKDLDPNYVIWLIQQNTDTKRFDVAEELGKKMLEWTESTPNGFEPEIRASLGVAYASIAFARQEFPRARAWLDRIAAAREFDGTRSQHRAQLKIAEVDRVTKQYEAAVTRLENLTRNRDRSLQADAYHQLALVRFDQEEFLEARDMLNEVFSRTPGHASARILQGQLNIKLRNLEEAREVAVGLASDKRFIVPGRPLKVSLEDRNLAIVKSGGNIEIRAWTDSGDDELFTLFPKGDSKTKFEGTLNTVLGPVKKGDRTLQLLGSDTVYYNFSPRFMGDRADKSEFPPIALEVVTDAQLFVSSGRILTSEELEERALEKLVRQRLRINADHLQKMVLDTERADDQIKPGNKINVRIIDPDRSSTAKADKLRINVTTSSGDRINGFELTETDTHSGIFEGAIPTSTGQATAYASDSEEGRDPNFAISSSDFPAWVGLPDNRRPKTFSVDLNDNVQLAKMSILADTPGRKLKDFLVQKSLNGRDYQTIGRWPSEHVPWDGSLRIELVKYVRGTIPLRTLNDYHSYIEKEYLSAGAPKLVLEPKQVGAKWNRDLNGHANKMQLGWSDWYIARLYGAFEVERPGIRTFKIEDHGVTKNIRYYLTINGKPAERNGKTITRSLSKGVHRIDVYVFAYRHANPHFQIMCDSDEPPFMVPCPVDMFDPKAHPNIKKEVFVEPAKVVANEDKTKFDIEFAKGANGRVVRLVLADFETDAPAISKVTLTDRADREILPTKEDFTKLKQNGVLEIVPGDRLTISYEDPKVIDTAKKSLSAFMSATFSNAEVSACFVEYDLDQRGERVAQYIPMRRFKPGDAIKVFINDPDGDVSEKMDVIEVTARTEGGQPIKVKAVETDEHTGIFVGTVLPISEAPQRDGELQVKAGEDVQIGYFDKENTDPGVPVYRSYRVEQALDEAPHLRILSLTSEPVDEDQRLTNTSGGQSDRRINEYIPATRNIIATRPTKSDPKDAPATVLVDGPFIVELIHPSVAKSPNSTASIYVQTSTARELYGQEIPEGVFDVNVPGTIKMTRSPRDLLRYDPPPGYQRVVMRGESLLAEPLEEGRFTFLLPVEMGIVPDQTLIYEDEEYRNSDVERTPLYIRGNDEVYVGYEYQDVEGGTNWVTQTIKLAGDISFHGMDRRYQELITGLHVGETAYFRIIHKTMDTTDDKDTLTVHLTTANGQQKQIELFETYGHSGIFKGFVRLVFAGENRAEDPSELSVVYGDVITASYTPTGGDALTHKLDVYKGSDGEVLPFTKRFKDPAIAVETQFTVAEAFFELAKRHRELGKESLARREIAQGKKLLEEAIRDFPDTAAQAQANYLLANLAFEFAKDAKNEQLQKEHYVEAINRFSDIVSSYPDSPYAPKSQYKKALVLEKMGDIDAACEEYVKLSYRYPENELVAETIARLGNYFLTKGREFNDRAGETEDTIEREKIKLQGFTMFTTAAQVFNRLGKRFPNHRLAGKTAVLSAQCYMLAEKFEKAIEGFKSVYTDPKADNDLAAESMYWCGDCHMKANQLTDAYQVFKKLTWDYPESKWAKYARGRLTDDALLRVAEQDADN